MKKSRIDQAMRDFHIYFQNSRFLPVSLQKT